MTCVSDSLHECQKNLPQESVLDKNTPHHGGQIATMMRSVFEEYVGQRWQQVHPALESKPYRQIKIHILGT